MRTGAYFLSAVMIASALGGIAHAQQQPSEQPAAQQPRETTTTPQAKDSNSQGTDPDNMGSTGWTGGTGGSHIGTSNTLTKDGTATSGSASPDTKSPAEMAKDGESAKGQPLMATGLDLKGEPTRFPANKTPE